MSAYRVGGTDDLVVYIVGPGFGESIVLRTPCGEFVVVDSCRRGSENLSESLLTELGCKQIDLFLLSHPDADHVRGASELIARFRPRQVWTYPLAVSLRTYLARVNALDPKGSKEHLSDIASFLEVLEPLREDGIADDVQSNSAHWTTAAGDCGVYAIAPSQSDIDHAGKQIVKLISRRGKSPELAANFADFLARRRSRLWDHPNSLSVALSVEWCGRRLLLGGDVELGSNENRGWRGALKRMARRGTLKRIRGLCVVKVAHHGSDGAFCEEAWKLHSEGTQELVALICPFENSELPTVATAGRIRDYAASLGTPCPTAGTLARVTSAGWRGPASSQVHPEWTLPAVAVVVPPAGSCAIHVPSGGQCWVA